MNPTTNTQPNFNFTAGFSFEPSPFWGDGGGFPASGDNYEKLQYYYHPDHLGSASYITNLDGEVVQHIAYTPLCEVFCEERNNTWNTPFLFNGKEYDSETGLYYYGARYYDARVSLWYGVDPLADHQKQAGVSPYAYANNNPIRYIDPTGMIWEDPKQAERLTKSVNNRIEDIEKNSAKIQAKIDEGGLSDKKLAKFEGRLAENSQKAELLNQSLSDIEVIGNATETFKLGSPSASDGTHGIVKGADGVITIEGSNTGLYIHEIRHVGQSIEAGGVKFNKDGRLLNAGTTYPEARLFEVEAYQAQYSYDGSYPAGASSLKDINATSLMRIKTTDGRVVYKSLQTP
ncbi:MAG: RHS repeat domain-containing protein [Mangrovibacterium sp.]